MRRYILATAASLFVQPALAETLTITDAYHFVDRVGTRSWTDTGEVYAQTFGVFEISLDSTEGTTGTYEQNGVTGDLIDVSSSLNKQFAQRLEYDPSLLGEWTLTFDNDGDTTVFVTPALGSAVAPDYVTSVTQSGPATTPTFTYDAPAGVDRIQLQIIDLTRARVASEIPDLIYQIDLSPTSNTFTIPEGILSEGGAYSIAFQADIDRDASGGLLGRSRVYYDFVAGALPDTGGVPVFLPTTDTTSGTPIFNFDNAVVKSELAFYDPIVAVGYEYTIGEGNPFFESVLLPDIGDGIFDLFLPDGLGGFEFVRQLLAGEQFFFDSDTSVFQILGIEPSLGLDPEDATAFVTGLSFVEDGEFTGTMKAITVETAVVPLPAAGWMFVAAIGGLITLRRSRR